MFGKKEVKEDKSGRIDSLIGPGTIITGDVSFAGGLRLDGEIHGDVTVSTTGFGLLQLGPEGVVKGNVRVNHLVADGEVHGAIYATDSVELRPTAKVQGDVHYGTLEMHPGAEITGHLVHI